MGGHTVVKYSSAVSVRLFAEEISTNGETE